MRKWKIVCLLFCLVMCCNLLTVGTGARGAVELDAPVSLSLTYGHDGTLFSDLSVRLHYVAEITPGGEFGLSDAFSEYALAVNTVKSQSEWKQIAQTAAAYAVSDALAPIASATTDENGTVQFEGLHTGLYLVEGIRVDYKDGYCQFDSFMIVLPGVDEDDDWTYDVDALPKSSYVEVEDDDIEYSVIKLWKDTGYETMRPKEVEIELYKNGVLEQTVLLSADNDWSYAWDAPDDGAIWTAVEPNVKNGYTVTLQQKGNTFVVTNTYKETPPPATGDATTGNVIVIVCAIVGIGLIVLGASRRRRV